MHRHDTSTGYPAYVRFGLGGRSRTASSADSAAYPVAVRSQRSLIDYSLARRAVLADVFAGRTSTTEVCDAHPYLLRAAKHHGEPTEHGCPVCRRDRLVTVTYVYGEQLGDGSGRVRASRELAALEAAYAEFSVYVVEVCPRCAWNHLRVSYLLGAAEPQQRRGRRRAAQK